MIIQDFMNVLDIESISAHFEGGGDQGNLENIDENSLLLNEYVDIDIESIFNSLVDEYVNVNWYDNDGGCVDLSISRNGLIDGSIVVYNTKEVSKPIEIVLDAKTINYFLDFFKIIVDNSNLKINELTLTLSLREYLDEFDYYIYTDNYELVNTSKINTEILRSISCLVNDEFFDKNSSEEANNEESEENFDLIQLEFNYEKNGYCSYSFNKIIKTDDNESHLINIEDFQKLNKLPYSKIDESTKNHLKKLSSISDSSWVPEDLRCFVFRNALLVHENYDLCLNISKYISENDLKDIVLYVEDFVKLFKNEDRYKNNIENLIDILLHNNKDCLVKELSESIKNPLFNSITNNRLMNKELSSASHEKTLRRRKGV